MDPERGTEVILRELLVPYVRQAFDDLPDVARDADLLVSHPVTFAAPIVADALRDEMAVGRPRARVLLFRPRLSSVAAASRSDPRSAARAVDGKGVPMGWRSESPRPGPRRFGRFAMSWACRTAVIHSTRGSSPHSARSRCSHRSLVRHNGTGRRERSRPVLCFPRMRPPCRRRLRSFSTKGSRRSCSRLAAPRLVPPGPFTTRASRRPRPSAVARSCWPDRIRGIVLSVRADDRC